VDDVPASKKLLRLTVDFGDHRRTILAGMKAERADPGEIVGRQALFVVNLEPRRMAGEIAEVRHWAELAFWFRPLSGPAGSRPVSCLDANGLHAGQPSNVSMADAATPGFATSHTYPTSAPGWRVAPLYRRLADVLNWEK
jgi:hypothetical protein